MATVRLCRLRNVNFLDVMINDASRDHISPVPFHLGRRGASGDVAALERAARVWRGEGLSFGLTTWISARKPWIDGMSRVGDLAATTGAATVTGDAEEPWIVPQRGAGKAVVTQRSQEVVSRLRDTCNAQLGVTHIVYANTGLIAPLVGLVDYDVPQAYATAKNASRRPAGELERIAHQRWSLGDPGRIPIVLGLAGWAQEGAYGLHYLDAWRASLTAARGLGCDVRIWRLDAIDAAEAQVMREVFGSDHRNAGGPSPVASC